MAKDKAEKRRAAEKRREREAARGAERRERERLEAEARKAEGGESAREAPGELPIPNEPHNAMDMQLVLVRAAWEGIDKAVKGRYGSKARWAPLGYLDANGKRGVRIAVGVRGHGEITIMGEEYPGLLDGWSQEQLDYWIPWGMADHGSYFGVPWDEMNAIRGECGYGAIRQDANLVVQKRPGGGLG